MIYFLIFFGFIMRIANHFHDHQLLAPIFAHFPNIPNFAPIGALALFSGVYLKKRYALLIPLAAMIISDYFIGFYNPYVMASVYLSFLIIGLIGSWLKNHKSVLNIISGSLLGSLTFFVLTNFTVWAAPNSYYPQTLNGLIDCYVLALPFFKNTISGDLFYVATLFGTKELSDYIVHKFYARKRQTTE